MRPSNHTEMSVLGIDESQLQAFLAIEDSKLELFRVAVEAQAQIAILSPSIGRPWAELSGRLIAAQKSDPRARPAVGDFVAASQTHEGLWRIEHVLPRRTQFLRQSARKRSEPQLVAANIDIVFVVTTPNEDFNLRRLERYFTTIHASGARPALVINKRDLVNDPQQWVTRALEVTLDAPIILTNAPTGEGVQQIRDLLGPRKTIALVGSSGVGKSSLTNTLLGTQQQTVQTIRESDDKGRHTTTHRELFILPNNIHGQTQGLLIDTPGMRALALWPDPDALTEAFLDIAELAEACRFRDCQHKSEPGCAVLAAQAEGKLSAGRLASYLRLREETRDQQQRTRRRGPSHN